MRRAPLVAAGSIWVLLAGLTLHAAYWDSQPLATGGPLGFGYFNATALQQSTGHLYVAYSDGDRDDVLVRWWDGQAWTVQTVDDGRDVARGIDLAFNAADRPAVSYAGGALKFAERTTTSWAIKTVESKNATNDVTSLEFSGGQPAISYYVKAGKNGGAVLKLARRSGTTWSSATVAPGTRYSSLAFDGSGSPAIAFAGDSNNDTLADALRLARLGPGGWTMETIDQGSGAGTWARLGFDGSGNPMIVDAPASTGTIRFWYQDGVGQWQQEFVGTGYRPALFVHQGTPIVSYASLDGYGLIVARRNGGIWTSELAATAPFGYVVQSSLTVPTDTGGEPVVAYCVDIYGIDASRTLWLARPPVN